MEIQLYMVHTFAPMKHCMHRSHLHDIAYVTYDYV